MGAEGSGDTGKWKKVQTGHRLPWLIAADLCLLLILSLVLSTMDKES